VSKTKKKVLLVTVSSIAGFCALVMALPLPGMHGVAQAAPGVPEVPVSMIPPFLIGVAALGRNVLARLR
jgi:hypothetical protein